MKFYLSFVLTCFCFWGASLSVNQNRGFSIELIGPDSSKSPFYDAADTQFQQVSKMVNHSINRGRYLNRAFSFSLNNMPQSTLTPYMGYGYAISYSIGTPPLQLYGIIDTGSELNWFQCKPCKPCLNQTSPIFDPSKSSTYKSILCSSLTCGFLGPKNCSSNSKKKCEYNYVYFDGSESQGDLSVDTLTMTSDNGSPISFQKFVIGCGHKNKVPLLEGSASGIIGLSRGSLSLISQIGPSIGDKFSYCLVPLFSKTNTSSKLNFGDTSMVYGFDTVSTPLEQHSNSDYFTTLEAFSVGDHIIRFNKSLTFGKTNTLIDSGSTITILPKYVYSKLEFAVASMVKLRRVKDPTQQMSLCYKTTLNMLKVPIITAHFTGADVRLNAINTFIPVGHEVVCFAFIEHVSPGVIFGNVQQQNFLVGFDLRKNILSFKPTDCTKS